MRTWMALSEAQVNDLWRALSDGLSKVPFIIPRNVVLEKLDDGIARVPPSLRRASVGDVLDQISSWRRAGSLR